MILPPDRHDPYRLVTVTVTGQRADQLIDEAVRQAALFLREVPTDLYAAEIGQAMVIERSRFRPHLGVQGHPILWSATIKVRLLPEVVKARRADGPEPPKPSGTRRRHLHSAG